MKAKFKDLPVGTEFRFELGGQKNIPENEKEMSKWVRIVEHIETNIYQNETTLETVTPFTPCSEYYSWNVPSNFENKIELLNRSNFVF